MSSRLLGLATAAAFGVLRSAAEDVAVTWTFNVDQGPYQVPVGGSFTFSYAGFHNVVQVADEAAFDNCNANNLGQLVGATGSGLSETLVFDNPGTYYFVCDIGSHCESGGMKLIIEVPNPPEPILSPPPLAPAPSPPSPTPLPPSEATIDWEFNNNPGPHTILKGGSVTFQYSGFHNIIQVPNEMMYNMCVEESGFILEDSQDSNINYTVTFNEVGTFYYICGIGNHCESQNMMAIVEVVDPPAPSDLVVSWVFNNDQGPFTIELGGTFTFLYGGFHNVVEVNSEEEMLGCDDANGVVLEGSVGSDLEFSITFETPGTFYYICSIGSHCSTFNMLLSIEVVGELSPPPMVMKLPKELSLAWAFFPETGPFTIAQGGLFTFDYVGGHNVHQVPSMEDMEACNFENAVLVQGTGPAVLKMNEEGVFYYVCTVGAGNHCGTFSMQATIIVVCDIPAGSGDPNDDGVVNVLDVVTSINQITSAVGEQPFNSCERAAADLDSDDEITVLDVVGMINLITS